MMYRKGKGRALALKVVLCFFAVLTGATAGADQTPDTSNTSVTHANWVGPYVGVYLGGSAVDADFTTNAGTVTNTSYFTSAADIASLNQSGNHSLHASVPIAGIQFGDNVFSSPWLTIGWVMDYSSFHLNESNSANTIAYPSDAGNYSLQTSVRTNWLSTVRGRFGITPPSSWPWMLYATGGVAVANVKVSNSFSDTTSLAGAEASSSSNNQIGWTVGTGLEMPLTQHLSINAEYLYVNLGSVDTTGSIQNTASGFGIGTNTLTNPLETSVALHANLFKLGLSYKF